MCTNHNSLNLRFQLPISSLYGYVSALCIVSVLVSVCPNYPHTYYCIFACLQTVYYVANRGFSLIFQRVIRHDCVILAYSLAGTSLLISDGNLGTGGREVELAGRGVFSSPFWYHSRRVRSRRSRLTIKGSLSVRREHENEHENRNMRALMAGSVTK